MIIPYNLGKLFVIEGLDGTGKTIQAGKLIIRIRREFPKLKVIGADFPRYKHESSYGVRNYLQKDGLKGYSDEVSKDPYASSILYAIDRFDAAHSLENENGQNMRDFLSSGGIIISNRYTQSNIGFQGGKIHSRLERIAFVDWLYKFEYELLWIPKPDTVIFLDLPPMLARDAKLAQLAVEHREADQHEANPQTFFRAQEAYKEAAERLPGWRTIDCMVPDGSRRKTTSEVHEDIFKEVYSFCNDAHAAFE